MNSNELIKFKSIEKLYYKWKSSRMIWDSKEIYQRLSDIESEESVSLKIPRRKFDFS